MRDDRAENFDGVAVGGPRHGVRILSGRARFPFPTISASNGSKRGKAPKPVGEYRWCYANEVWVWHDSTNPENK